MEERHKKLFGRNRSSINSTLLDFQDGRARVVYMESSDDDVTIFAFRATDIEHVFDLTRYTLVTYPPQDADNLLWKWVNFGQLSSAKDGKRSVFLPLGNGGDGPQKTFKESFACRLISSREIGMLEDPPLKEAALTFEPEVGEYLVIGSLHSQLESLELPYALAILSKKDH